MVRQIEVAAGFLGSGMVSVVLIALAWPPEALSMRQGRLVARSQLQALLLAYFLLQNISPRYEFFQNSANPPFSLSPSFLFILPPHSTASSAEDRTAPFHTTFPIKGGENEEALL